MVLVCASLCWVDVRRVYNLPQPFRRVHPFATSLQVLVCGKGLDSSSMRSPVHLLSLLAFHALVAPFASAALAPHRPLLRPGAALTPACSSDLNDLSRQWLVQELESELLVEERAPSKQIGGDIRHTRSFPYMTRIGPVHPTYLRRSPYVSKAATPSRATSCRMMARGKPGAKTTRRTSRRATSKPEVEPAQPGAAMLQGVATILSAAGAAGGALLCRQAGGTAPARLALRRRQLSAPGHA